jgi:hypothetical protein
VTVPVLSVVVVVVSVVSWVPVATVVEVEDVCPYATKPIRAMTETTLKNNLIILNFLSYQVAAVIAAQRPFGSCHRMSSANQTGKSMRQFAKVTNKSSRATRFVAQLV